MSIHIGHVDPGKKPSNIKDWLKPFHRYMRVNQKNSQFRGEKLSKWFSFSQLSSRKVVPLQEFLQQTGFYPHTEKTGIFGYGTRSAVRLFQEYVRNIEGDSSVGVPDGWAGPKTLSHIERWKRDGLSSQWNQYSLKTPSQEYLDWFRILNKAKLFYLTSEDPVIENLRSYFRKGNASSLPPERWTYRPYDAHLLGIRRQPEVAFSQRPNDDLFILLIRGLVFKFWGSTDPNPGMVTTAAGAPFLTEGQHKYHFGWHKIWSKEKVYMALKPYSPGALVFRDRNKRNKLLPDDIHNGFDEPNTTINIHWTPNAFQNWSAGCQVINGESYITPENKVISCREYCASGYRTISSSKTKGAYNVLTDLVICYSQPNNDTVWYTLGRLNNLEELETGFNSQFVEEQMNRLKA